MMVETYLLRGKRRMDQWALHPGIRTAVRLILYCSGGFLMAAATAWGYMQPFAACLVCGTGGVWAPVSAMGSILGYRILWGPGGVQGVIWTLCALAVSRIMGRWMEPDRRATMTAAAMALAVSVTGLGFQLWMGDTTPLTVYLERVAAAGGAALLFMYLSAAKNTMAQWMAGGLWVLALAGISGIPWMNLGCIAAGALAAAAPLPAAAMAGMGLEAAGIRTMTAGLCMACFLRMAPVRDRWRRLGAPALGCLAAMAICREWNWPAWLSVSLGGAMGAMVPWHWSSVTRPTGTAAAQVQLEQTARIFGKLQRMLMEIPTPGIDTEAMADKLRQNACSECSCRSSCREQNQLDQRILSEPLSFTCRKTGRVLREARRSQEQIRRMKGERVRQGEYRTVLVQQYGFLAGYLQLMADRLPTRSQTGPARYHIQVSARSRGKELADGDSVLAFPGMGLKYYVLLCDGMGTGMGAAEQSNLAAQLIRQMLTAGLPPQYALGSINSHLALRGQAGAVTVDLAEIRLDSGRAAVYKWGAAPSLLLRRGKAIKIGTATAPPGISVTQIREAAAKLSLKRGEVLVLASDGVEVGEPWRLADEAEDVSPGELADYILREFGGNGEDDATAAVIRLRPIGLAT